MHMTISAKSLSTAVLLFAAGFVVAALLAFVMVSRGDNANAQGLTCTVDESLVTKIYDAVFKRPVDAAGRGYIGQDVGFMIDEMAKSQEHKMYSAMFKSMKALEEAERQPGGISVADRAIFKNMLDSSLSNISSWSHTLPEQAAADAVIGPEHAREALNFAHSIIPEEFRREALNSFFDPTILLGAPTGFQIPEQYQLDFADAQLRLEQEIQDRIDLEGQYRLQIEEQYKLREQQEAAFLEQYGTFEYELTPEQQEAFVREHRTLEPVTTDTTTDTGGTTSGGSGGY